jgi:hypothetical protein
MPVPAATRRTLAPLAIVTAAAYLFALLLILVRLHRAPLESVDHGAATWLNSLVAGHAVVIVLALRRRWRLTAYLLVTGGASPPPPSNYPAMSPVTR